MILRRSADDAIRELNGQDFFGLPLAVSVARPPPNKERNSRARSDARLSVSNLDPRTSWQDLKGKLIQL